MRIFSLLVCVISLYGPAQAQDAVVWIGMSTPMHGEKEGIYRATLNLDTGAITQPGIAMETKMPEFLALHPDGKHLYAACQLSSGQSGVAGFEISDDQQHLTLLNQMPTGRGQSCHVAVDRKGGCLFSAQYGGGSITAFPLSADGRILENASQIQHTGSGPNRVRQEGPHPHFVGTDPANKFLFVPDLGTDEIVIYKFDAMNGALKRHGAGHCPPGSGPRHLAFHPNGHFVYIVNEMKITLTAFRYDSAAGTLKEIQTIESLRDKDRKIPSTAAELYIHPSGKFLYASTRNDDSITTFQIDPTSGLLTYVEREPIRGSHPRSFNLDPTGHWLLAAGRDSDTISVFRIDQNSGRLFYTNKIVRSPQPICVEIQVPR
jgi:6-phosphogluconolactonase